MSYQPNNQQGTPYGADPYGQQPGPGYQPPQYQQQPPGYQQPQYQQPSQQPWPQQPGGPQGGPPRRGHTLRNVLLASGAVVVVLIALGAALSAGQQPTRPAAAASPRPSSVPSPAARPKHSAAVAPAHAAAAKPASPYVIAHFTGSGIENTPQFTTLGTWTLKWSYNCASFGQLGNFAVLENGGTGMVTVNELGPGGHGTTYGYGDAGRHYLAVDSECAWSMRVIGQ
jgi:hypothetical protein